MELPKYRSHKVVEAAPIEFLTEGMVHVKVGETIHGVAVPEDFYGRGTPQLGDYIVRYQPDGYLSWSPREAFEDGYTRL